MNNRCSSSRQDRHLLWLVEAGSGLLLAVLLCLHMIANQGFLRARWASDLRRCGPLPVQPGRAWSWS